MANDDMRGLSIWHLDDPRKTLVPRDARLPPDDEAESGDHTHRLRLYRWTAVPTIRSRQKRELNYRPPREHAL